MKNKTLLKFLLCFFIISCMCFVSQTQADETIPFDCGACGEKHSLISEEEFTYCQNTSYLCTTHMMDLSAIKVKCANCDGYIKKFEDTLICDKSGKTVVKKAVSYYHSESYCGVCNKEHDLKVIAGFDYGFNHRLCEITGYVLTKQKNSEKFEKSYCSDANCSSKQSCIVFKNGKYICEKSGEEVYVDRSKSGNEINMNTWIHNSLNCKDCRNNTKVVQISNGTYICENNYRVIQVKNDEWIHTECPHCLEGELKYNSETKKFECTKACRENIEIRDYEFGVSAKWFFERGKGYGVDNDKNVMEKGMEVLKKEISPLLHIQSLIMYIGILCAVGVSIFYGIQWTIATPNKRQELKSSIPPLVIGVLLLSLGPKVTVEIYNALIADNAAAVDHFRQVAGTVINTIQLIGYVVSIIMVLWLGIQWTTSTPNKKQELKGRAINLLIGAILITGCVTILDKIYEVSVTDMSISEQQDS